MTTEEFIKKAREVHGDKYDYSKVEYVNNQTKVCIVCPEHGEYLQRPDKHIGGHGCPTGGKEKSRQSLKKTQEQFIEEARKVHGDRYDYSKVNYVGVYTKVIIICPIHGEFGQRPDAHLHGKGCPDCGMDSVKIALRRTQEQFIADAKRVWGDRYDYSLVNYVNNATKVELICKEHGSFLMSPRNFLSGHGCPKCAEIIRQKHRDDTKPTTEDFIRHSQSVHGNKYDYSKVEYVNNQTKVCIICPEHGDFLQRPDTHLQGNGCPICGREAIIRAQTNSQEHFIEKAKAVWGDTLDFSQTIYGKSLQDEVIVVCPKHGEFSVKATKLLYRHQGCPQCSESVGENEIRRFLMEHGIEYETLKSFPDCRDQDILRFDFYLPKRNVCIEFNGIQHYEIIEFFGGEERFKNQQFRDNIKRQYCKDNGIRLIEIRYDEDVEKVLKMALQGLNVPRKDSI